MSAQEQRPDDSSGDVKKTRSSVLSKTTARPGGGGGTDWLLNREDWDVRRRKRVWGKPSRAKIEYKRKEKKYRRHKPTSDHEGRGGRTAGTSICNPGASVEEK